MGPLSAWLAVISERLAPEGRRYHAAAHTSAVALGTLAARTRPKLLVLTHTVVWSSSPGEIVREVRAAFGGAVAFANDLDIY